MPLIKSKCYARQISRWAVLSIICGKKLPDNIPAIKSFIIDFTQFSQKVAQRSSDSSRVCDVEYHASQKYVKLN